MTNPDIEPTGDPVFDFHSIVTNAVCERYSGGKFPKRQGRVDAVTFIVAELALFRHKAIFGGDAEERELSHIEIPSVEQALEQAAVGKGRERWSGVRNYLRHRAETMWNSEGHSQIPPRREFRRFRRIPGYRDLLAFTNLSESI